DPDPSNRADAHQTKCILCRRSDRSRLRLACVGRLASAIPANPLKPNQHSKCCRSSRAPSSSMRPEAMALFIARSPIHTRVMVCRVGRNVKTDLESWIGGTKIHLLPLPDHPPSSFPSPPPRQTQLPTHPPRPQLL